MSGHTIKKKGNGDEMMKRKFMITALLFGALLMFVCGCAKSGHSAELTLESNPSTGFDWKTDYDRGVRVDKEVVTDEDSEEMVGVPENRIYTITFSSSGRHSVTFTYEKAGTDEKGNCYTYVFDIAEDGSIKLVESDGKNLAVGGKTIPAPDIEIK